MTPVTPKNPNTPNLSIWDRTKTRAFDLRNRALLFVEDVRPHPIDKWKKADPRVKNLFVSAAIAAPGFVAGVAGGAQILQDKDMVADCANRPVASSINAETCDALASDRSSGINLIFGGGIEVIAVAGVGTFRDGRLAKREQSIGRDSLRRPQPQRTLQR